MATLPIGKFLQFISSLKNDDGEERPASVDSELSRDSRSVQSAPPLPLLGLQVWRPLPPINESTGTGRYSLVGSQGISSISIPADGDGLILRPSRRINIPFQPGDVLGFYVSISNTNDYDGRDLEIQPALGNKTVWYTSTAIRQLTLRVPPVYLVENSTHGDLASSSSVAPAISIAVGKLVVLIYNNYATN